eukprot:3929838-Amphidinium_carterae.1
MQSLSKKFTSHVRNNALLTNAAVCRAKCVCDTRRILEEEYKHDKQRRRQEFYELRGGNKDVRNCLRGGKCAYQLGLCVLVFEVFLVVLVGLVVLMVPSVLVALVVVVVLVGLVVQNLS